MRLSKILGREEVAIQVTNEVTFLTNTHVPHSPYEIDFRRISRQFMRHKSHTSSEGIYRVKRCPGPIPSSNIRNRMLLLLLHLMGKSAYEISVRNA